MAETAVARIVPHAKKEIRRYARVINLA
jgi:hypothetical protein